MKNRSTTIFTTILSVAACFGFAFGAPGPDTPDPIGPVNSNTEDGFRAVENSANAFNSGFGWFSLFTNTDAFFNTGMGAGTLFANDGPNNTAVGAAALFFNSTGGNENAVGVNALRDNTIGFFNNAHGTFALFSNQDGGQNNAFGDQALIDNVSGNFNTGIGDDALLTCTGNSNTALGDEAGASVAGGEGNIYIGAQVTGVADEPEFIRIGNDTAFTFPYDTFIAGIFGRSNDPGTATICYVDANGKLASIFSSRRYKHDIKPMDNASETILAFKPVSFHYNSDAKNTPCFGLIAEEVAAVNPDLVIRDKEGEPMTVRYDQINAMLLNEFLKEHKRVEAQQASISQLKSEMQTMVAQLKEQAAQIQKVSAQLEVNKPAPQVVANKP
jgi:trimeric autotransporter adhesin